MNIQIYFPSDLIRRIDKSPLVPYYLIGYHIKEVYVVIDLHLVERDLHNLPSSLHGLELIGSINTEKASYDLQFFWDDGLRLPYLKSSSNNYFIIISQPPKFKNLEYFSINPIYLQSMGKEIVSPNTNQLYQKLEASSVPSSESFSISDNLVLDKLNQTLRLRIDLDRMFKKSNGIKFPFISKLLSSLKTFAFTLIVFIIKRLQYILIIIINLLNYKAHGISLVDVSLVFKQLDLRLKQFNYFPIQFLCYYDKSILYNQESVLLKNLKLPVFNSNLNVNNSNYINFYNSIWLIFNDILLGVTAYKVIIINQDFIMGYIHKYIIEKLMFNDLHRLISWVSFNHPAGFKLNNELGQFMGDLYLWSLKFWKYLLNDLLEKEVLERAKQQMISIVLQYVKFICYVGGFSFLLGSIIDVLRLFFLHITGFYQTSTKVYNRQIQVLKSLFQLFRGKKYNVLRNRIDNLDIYSAGDSFEIVQFLMGTLMFMILILLLPTVFAFYLMFFSLELAGILILVCLECMQIIVTCAPLFMILLKVKNSNRLQGGIGFEFLRKFNTTTYVKLSNKSLGYLQIFNNFKKLFKNCINFRKPLFHFFLFGEPISIAYDKTLKFNYLMLPDKYEETVNIWESFSNSQESNQPDLVQRKKEE